ncbi:MAG TPA: RNA-binding protein [Brevundimonas sp.]|nr:RNA-binding protein [Brevundimonas sp.]
MSIEVFLDDTPGEVRGVVVRDGRFHNLLIQREDADPAHRLGARLVGRVATVVPGLKGAFVDLGAPLQGFLPFSTGSSLSVGEKLEVEVSAEPREQKGPTLRRVGAGEGEPRLLRAGPTVMDSLARLAPGAAVVTGVAAIRAAMEAEEAAMACGELFPDTGLDLRVERTRALVAVDLDLAPSAGVSGGAAARTRANRQGLREAARLIGLKRWGGLIAVDLIGAGHDGEAALAAAKLAFAHYPEAVFGPVSRFGLMQFSIPWRMTPLEELLAGPDGVRRPEQKAQDLVRALRLRLLSDTTAPRMQLRCAPADGMRAAPGVARLGPRAGLIPDPTIASGRFVIEET